MDKALIIFGKTPEPGKVKTRLAVDLGEKEACDVYRKLLFYTFDVAEKCNVYVVASFPEKNEQLLEAIPYSHFHQQAEGDLGEKLKEASHSIFTKGFEKVICIGSDCADLTSEIIKEAFSKLNTKDIVLGPAKDGGYYLIGMKKPSKYLFDGKTWSSSILLEETLKSIEENKNSVSLLPELSDIDTIEDLQNCENKAISFNMFKA